MISRLCRGLLCIGLATLVGRSPAWAQPPVTALAKPDATPQTAELFRQSRDRLVSPQDPQFREIYENLVKLTQRILLPEDGEGPIRIALIDDLRPNACFVQLEDGERVLGVNTGLLRYMETDDEIVFALGHELEHGVSQIQEYIEELRRAREYGAQVMGLQRAVENEVDVQSILRRMHKNGFNPNAPVKYFSRVINDYGDGISFSHSLASSRKDTASLAVGGLRRVLGEVIKEDVPEAYQRQVISAAHKVLKNEAYQQERLRSLEKLLRDFDNPYLQPMRELQASTKAHLPDHSHMTTRAFFEQLSEIEKLTHGWMSPEERLNWEIKLQEALFRKLEEARKTVLGNDFRNLSAAQISSLKSFYAGDLATSVSDVNSRVNDYYGDIVSEYRRYKNREENYRRAKAAVHGPHDLSGQAALKKAERDYLAAKKDIEFHLSSYEPGTQAVVEKHYHEYEAYYVRHPNGGVSEEWKIVGDLHNEIRSRRRGIATLMTKRSLISKAILKQGFEGILKNASSLDALEGSLRDVLEAAPDLIDADPVRVLEAYAPAARRQLKAERDSKFISQTWLSYNNDTTNYILDEALKRDRKRAFDALGHFVDALIDDSPGIDALAQALMRVGPTPREIKSSNRKPFLVHGGGMNGGLTYSDELARHIFTPERTERLLRKAMELGVQDIRTPSEYVSSDFDRYFLHVSDVMSYYSREVRALRESGLLPAKKIDVNGSAGKILDAASEALKARLPANVGLSEAVYKDLILAKNSWMKTLFDPQNTRSHRLLRESMLTAMKNPVAAPHLKNFVSYFDVFELFDFRVPGQKEEFFKFVYDMREMISFDDVYGVDRDRLTARWKEVLPLSEEYSDWLGRHHPDAQELRYAATNPEWVRHEEKTPEVIKFLEARGHLANERSKAWENRFKRGGSISDYEKAWLGWYGESGRWGKSETRSLLFSHASSPEEKLKMFNGLVNAMRQSKHGVSEYELEKEIAAVDSIIRSGWIDSVRDPELLLQTHANFLELNGNRQAAAKVYDQVWNRRSEPAVARALSDPKVVGRLYYDEDKRALALWQLEREFDLEKQTQQIAKRKVELSGRGIRPEVERARAFIDEQFPGKSAVKNSVLGALEDTLVTNSEETRLLAQSRLGAANWHESKSLAAVDLPHLVAKELNDYQKFEWIRYLNGTSQTPPPFRVPYGLEKKYGNSRELAEAARRSFTEADIFTRTYALQSLLDEQRGVLSDPRLAEELYRSILGTYADDALYRKTFFAYMNALPEAERKGVLGYVLGSIADRPPGSGASVKAVLEAMGVFGIKAGQFLRTSGHVSPELRVELDDFFDRALKPGRGEIIDRVEDVFGKQNSPVKVVRHLGGSGSVNYGVIADLHRPDSSVEPVFLRFRRDRVEGRVVNENDNWMKAIATLREDSDSSAHKLARVLDESRAHSMETLKAGGAELDLSVERAAFPEAQRAYARAKGAGHRFSIDVTTPSPLQARVPAEYSRLVSVYEAVDHVPWRELSAGDAKAAAREIVEAELKALFQGGVFDPDGHPGNWLVDLKNGRLVRTDYAQLRRMTPEQTKTLRDFVKGLIEPSLKGREGPLAASLNSFFDIQAVPKAQLEKLLRDICADTRMPSYVEPQERLFFMRDELEKALARNGYTAADIKFKPLLRGAMSSLGRTSVYAEHIGERAYVELILKQLGIRPGTYGAKVLVEEAKIPNKCLDFLRKVFKRK